MFSVYSVATCMYVPMCPDFSVGIWVTCTHVQCTCKCTCTCIKLCIYCSVYEMVPSSSREDVSGVKQTISEGLSHARGCRPLRLSLQQLASLAQHFQQRVNSSHLHIFNGQFKNLYQCMRTCGISVVGFLLFWNESCTQTVITYCGY